MISVIIPHYSFPESDAYLKDCVDSLQGCDELIIVLNKDGFSKAVNAGLKIARGDYIAIINNDTKMLEGSLADYCLPNALVRPTLIHGDLAKFAFAVFSREVFDKVGFLDEQFETGYFEDDDYLRRCQLAGVQLVTLPLQVWHQGSVTMERFNMTELMATNKQKYQTKWASQP